MSIEDDEAQRKPEHVDPRSAPTLGRVLSLRETGLTYAVASLRTARTTADVHLVEIDEWNARRRRAGRPEVELQPRSTETTAQDTAERQTELMTEYEHHAMKLLAEVANAMGRIVGGGTSRVGDLREAVGLIHGLQQMVLSQAAARAYPDRYRLLGGMPGWRS